ncbi:helix-turn-helix domain-containing protein [Heliorestis convoluta]|uniref:Helix-turn-helix domain-containing protein, putative n=1 Tax=Heliorestis convoluta TaxID=356322 RepID=A0A5Q2N1H0_9FIRM|nr:helix-turn-helix domain-containing protein [Heliorestis convoluta]QGG47663.1 helix-turn-helix domain-containing protein, putative [Heliorestis convoluta]
MKDQMLALEVKQSFNVLNKTWDNQIFLKLYVSLFTSGLVSQLGSDRTITLLAIASFMNEKGECYPTQEQIAERIGVTRKTAARYIESLLNFRWNDQPIITRIKKRNSSNALIEFSVYTVLPLSQVAIFHSQIDAPEGIDDTPPMSQPYSLDVSKVYPRTVGKIEPSVGKKEPPVGKTDPPPVGNALPINKNHINKNHNNKKDIESGPDAVEEKNKITAPSTAREFYNYFSQSYQSRYISKYQSNWERDIDLLKDKLLPHYSPEQLQAIIDTVFEEYEYRWKRKNYLRPTIGQLASWLAEQVHAVVEDKKEQERQYAKIQKHGGMDVDEILKRIKKGRVKE